VLVIGLQQFVTLFPTRRLGVGVVAMAAIAGELRAARAHATPSKTVAARAGKQRSGNRGHRHGVHRDRRRSRRVQHSWPISP